MSIVKVKKYDCPYVQIDKRPLSDKRLSWKAKGILVYLLSKPDDWHVWVRDLAARSTDGEGAVRTGLEELFKAGYATRQQGKKENGTFAPVNYTVYERPHGGFPHAVQPHADNRQHSNKESTNNAVETKDVSTATALPAVSPLAPSAPTALRMFERLTTNARAKGRRGPKRFPSLECKQKFDTAAETLNGEYDRALTKALEQGITSVTGITNYIAKWAGNLKPRHIKVGA